MTTTISTVKCLRTNAKRTDIERVAYYTRLLIFIHNIIVAHNSICILYVARRTRHQLQAIDRDLVESYNNNNNNILRIARRCIYLYIILYYFLRHYRGKYYLVFGPRRVFRSPTPPNRPTSALHTAI